MNAFLTVSEIAELLKINPQTVRNMIDRDELKAVRVGARRVRVRQSDLDDFLAIGGLVAATGDEAAAAPEDSASLDAEIADALRTLSDARLGSLGCSRTRDPNLGALGFLRLPTGARAKGCRHDGLRASSYE